MTYTAPVEDILFALEEVADLQGVAALPGFAENELNSEFAAAILEEAGKFTSGVLAPLNRAGDIEGAKMVDGKVQLPEGWTEAYGQFVEAGWNGLSFPTEFGGQGLPYTLATAFHEMLQSSNMAFGLCPLLTQGAVEAIEMHASDELKAQYLPKMVTGEWPGTMNLTEPQAGSDLAAIKTRAEPDGDAYRIFGQKIYITYGEHEMTDNIIHLVLARLPDAPEGVRGISLFVVPKFLLDDSGNAGERNDVRAISLEHKLGIHGSPTAVMSYGEDQGAKGWLVGEPNKGLSYMFTMMNMARHAVGVQGVAIAERAYQQALAFANERVQGVPVGDQVEGRATIIHHPDVRRMLMMMKSQIEAMRALALFWSSSFDKSNHSEDKDERAQQLKLAELLTPVVKGWSTELGNEIASLGVQIHGGMGFIEETGAAQHLRDARIITIYEGTTGIQANDLVGRKILRDGGEVAKALIATMGEVDEALGEQPGNEFADIRASLAQGIDDLKEATAWLLETGGESPELALASAVPYLRLWGTVAGGWMMAKSAVASARRQQDESGSATFNDSKVLTARFYAMHVLPQAASYSETVRTGADSVLALAVENF